VAVESSLINRFGMAKGPKRTGIGLSFWQI